MNRKGEMPCFNCNKKTTAPFCSMNCKYIWTEKNPDKRITWDYQIKDKCK